MSGYGVGPTTREWYGILALAVFGLVSLIVSGVNLLCWLLEHLRWVS
jgi:hypothetical protein